MSIKIDFNKPEIEFNIAGMDFVYDYSDEAMERLEEGRKSILGKLKDFNIEESKSGYTDEDEKVVSELRKIVHEGFDLFLGEGSFHKLYEKIPSSMALAQAFFNMDKAIDVELEKRGFNQSAKRNKMKEYLESKNKNKEKKKQKQK